MNINSVTLRIAGVKENSPVLSVLEQRSEILQLTENSHDAVLHPHDVGGVSYALRAVIATRISAIHEDELQSHYLKLLEDSDESLYAGIPHYVQEFFRMRTAQLQGA